MRSALVMQEISVAGTLERYERWDARNFKFEWKNRFMALPEVTGGIANRAARIPHPIGRGGAVSLSHRSQRRLQD